MRIAPHPDCCRPLVRVWQGCLTSPVPPSCLTAGYSRLLLKRDGSDIAHRHRQPLAGLFAPHLHGAVTTRFCIQLPTCYSAAPALI